MDFTSVIGVIASIGFILVGYTMDGGSLLGLFMPNALAIVAGGTFGTLFLSFSFGNLKHFPGLIIDIFKITKSRVNETIELLVSLARTAKQDGLLSLEKAVSSYDDKKGGMDPFIKKGILIAVDGTDTEKIQEILGNDIYIYEQKRLADIAMFETCAQFAPAFGMIGTIAGLIQMLSESMDDPGKLTKAIGVAFVATFYGCVFSNCLFAPAAAKLKSKLEAYKLEKVMIIDAICAIRNGINPKLLREQIEVYGNNKNKGQKAEVLTMMESDNNSKRNSG